MRLKDTVFKICVSTTRARQCLLFEKPPAFETTLESDDLKIEIPNGEMVVGRYNNEHAAKRGHAIVVAWVRGCRGKVTRARLPALAQD